MSNIALSRLLLSLLVVLLIQELNAITLVVDDPTDEAAPPFGTTLRSAILKAKNGDIIRFSITNVNLTSALPDIVVQNLKIIGNSVTVTYAGPTLTQPALNCSASGRGLSISQMTFVDFSGSFLIMCDNFEMQGTSGFLMFCYSCIL